MFNKKPLLNAGISGILLFVIPILLNILGIFVFPEFFSVLSGVSYLALSMFFLYGFYYLGLKYKSKFFSVISCISIILVIVFYASMFLLDGRISQDAELFNQTITQQQIVLDSLNAANASAGEIAVVQEEMGTSLWEFVAPYFIGFMIYFFVWILVSILFNMGLIRLKKVEYAKVTGIIGLVSIGLTLTIIGIFLAIPLLIAYYIMLIVILFKQVEKFKEIR